MEAAQAVQSPGPLSLKEKPPPPAQEVVMTERVAEDGRMAQANDTSALMSRRRFLAAAAGCTAGAALGQITAHGDTARKRLNVLLITADDMNWNTPGFFGGRVPDITPNIDRLAREGMRFERAHVTIAVCMPSRETLMTGRYPHHHGGMGFEPIRTDVPTLQEQLKAAGYLNGILGKVAHLKPDSKFPWDMNHDAGELGGGRDPELYHRYCLEFFQRAAKEGKPFFLMANSHDPHRPFCGSDSDSAEFRKPSRIYKPEEIEVPGSLPDIPDIRTELAQYFSSARRCDDTVGMVLKALKESGQEDNTLVMFLSDNGMSFPYAKTNCYLNSTHTPWIVRWPGKTRPGSVDQRHFISGIDYMPTILDALGLKPPRGMDGESFVPLLSGKDQPGRERVFTEFFQTSAKKDYPMRCVQDAQFGYIYNQWSDGKTVFKNEPQSGLTWKAMVKAAKTDPKIRERVEFFSYRCPEELYDFTTDPNALTNLAGNPEHKARLASMRAQMLEWMEKMGDPMLAEYRKYVSAHN